MNNAKLAAKKEGAYERTGINSNYISKLKQQREEITINALCWLLLFVISIVLSIYPSVHNRIARELEPAIREYYQLNRACPIRDEPNHQYFDLTFESGQIDFKKATCTNNK
ncbi:hypothetical protein [Paraburkholderia fungorum]|jgi:hypothetical protein|uniref:hypothetical protein n=1 Tax=Paraburkholderia fungorum TaxID=134537 RepID=UPI000D4397ED|nr:hypothetical protein [Paraburkholderia fungorum]PRZ45396.1 hypothetical protein BX589_13975 [Paraburkholderia fungorum]